MVQNFRQRVYAVVRKIPKGKVATYGQVARLAGAPAAARQVGYALAAINGLLPPTCKTPWQRVVNRLGEISYSLSRGGGDDLQRVMLEDEGVVFDKDGKIEMGRFQWVGEKNKIKK